MLIAGLGNPGREYECTRHNVGWLVVDELARRAATSFRSKFNGKLAETRLAEQRVILLEPETYMNESGRSIGPALAFYKLPPAELKEGGRCVAQSGTTGSTEWRDRRNLAIIRK